MIAVDVAGLQLFGENNGVPQYARHVDLCIDHHAGNNGYADFTLLDAGAAAAQLAAEGARPDVIVVDPPRKGCDEATLTAIAEMAPRTVVMVSCNAATAARDTRWLAEHGYKAVEVQPVDLFPRTKHVECVVKLTKDVK